MRTLTSRDARNLRRPPAIGRGAFRSRLLLLVVCSAMLSAFAACREDPPEENAVPTRDINAVIADRAEALLADPDVVMVAVGELADKTPAIQVYVRRDDDEVRRRIGATIEGHPVDFIVSDDIRPLR